MALNCVVPTHPGRPGTSLNRAALPPLLLPQPQCPLDARSAAPHFGPRDESHFPGVPPRGELQAPAHVRILPFIRSPAVIGTVTSKPPTARVSRSHLRAGVRGGARLERPHTARASRSRAPDCRRPPGAAAPPARPTHSHGASLKVAAGRGSASAPGPDPEPEAGRRKREAAPCSPPGTQLGRPSSSTLLGASGSGP